MAALLALGSSVIWGSADFLGGLLTRTRSAYVVVAGSQAFGLLAIAIVALVTGDWREPVGYLPWAVGAGLSGAVGLVAYYAALSSGTMGVVAPIASMGAVVPVILGIAGGEHPSWVQLLGIVLALLGVAAASGPELSGGHRPPPGGPGRPRRVRLRLRALRDRARHRAQRGDDPGRHAGRDGAALRARGAGPPHDGWHPGRRPRPARARRDRRRRGQPDVRRVDHEGPAEHLLRPHVVLSRSSP